MFDYGARWYASDAPRWINIDPLGELRANLSPYQYVQNNPINAIDPTGMLDESFYKGSGASFDDKYMKSKGEQMSEEGDKWRNEGQSTFKWSPYGTKTYDSEGNLLNTTIDGYNVTKDCDCGGQGQPPCKGVTYRYKRASEIEKEGAERAENYGIRMPDFYSINVGVPLNPAISWNINVAMDRHFQFYVSPIGVSAGVPFGRSFSLTASWLQQPKKPNSIEMYNFLSGHATGASLGYIVGGVYNESPTNAGTKKAWGFGLMTPQLGFSYNYTPDALIFYANKGLKSRSKK